MLLVMLKSMSLNTSRSRLVMLSNIYSGPFSLLAFSYMSPCLLYVSFNSLCFFSLSLFFPSCSSRSSHSLPSLWCFLICWDRWCWSLLVLKAFLIVMLKLKYSKVILRFLVLVFKTLQCQCNWNLTYFSFVQQFLWNARPSFCICSIPLVFSLCCLQSPHFT